MMETLDRDRLRKCASLWILHVVVKPQFNYCGSEDGEGSVDPVPPS